MSSSAISKILVGIAIFLVTSLLQMAWLTRSALRVADFDQVTEVTGPFRYVNYGRNRTTTWVGDKSFYCSADSQGGASCLTYIGPLKTGSIITVKSADVNRKNNRISLALNIVSEGKQLFDKAPEDYIETWKRGNLYWLFFRSFFCALVVVMFWAIFSSSEVI